MCKNIPIIKHPGAALIVPFLGNGKVVMLRQYRPVIKKYLYELPAGTLEENETPLACARRELIEETGFSAGKLIKLGFIYPVPGYSTEKIFIYKAFDLKRAKMRLENDEIIERNIVTRGKARSLLKSGKINDAKTICALALCGWI
ncbi:MAG: NUDIX hydrolase [Candidatus Omnitrophica bacterium]|jgi:ADP-ribose pyrophosphatase|nr:NUDIX hydrolase [Candidatus Omnitrophota bacterium]